MKLRLLVAVTFLIGVLMVSAQEEEKKGYFKFGPKFGLDLNADFNNLPSGNQILGELEGNYQVGAFAQLGKRLYFQPEVMYAVQSFTDGQGVKNNVESLRVPLHVGLKFFDIGLLSLHISFGAMYTHEMEKTFKFDKEKLNYQVGVGVDVFNFITTDIRYTLAKDVSFADQVSDFTEKGGMVNITVGLKL